MQRQKLKYAVNLKHDVQTPLVGITWLITYCAPSIFEQRRKKFSFSHGNNTKKRRNGKRKSVRLSRRRREKIYIVKQTIQVKKIISHLNLHRTLVFHNKYVGQKNSTSNQNEDGCFPFCVSSMSCCQKQNIEKDYKSHTHTQTTSFFSSF